MNNYAGIVINNSAKNVDLIFTYSIPDSFKDEIKTGQYVSVPFGSGNRYADGFIFELYNEVQNSSFRIKPIKAIKDNNQILSNESIELIKFMRKYYLCTYIEGIKTLVPSGIFDGVKDKEIQVVCLSNELFGKYRKENYLKIIDCVKKDDETLTARQLATKYNISISSIKTLIKQGFLKEQIKKINRYNKKEYELYSQRKLNKEQINVCSSVLSGIEKEILIHGITGSGKTEVYLNIANEYLNKGKDVIMLVPEISLTPQMVERFKGRFGSKIAVFHSMLGYGERFDEWKRIYDGEVKIAIGVRSAVFLPFKNLGIIIMDEEHDSSYKSWTSPKYDTREIARQRCEFHGAKLLLGSATPSVETYYRATTNQIKYLRMDSRADGASLPEIKIVDMKEELKNGNMSMFSRELYTSIEESLKNKEQIIIFINRRGYSGFVSCRKCGFVYKCPKCDISLNYHITGNRLTCHYCGYTETPQKTCPACKSKYIKLFSAGTEKVEHQLKKYFSEAKIMRMDFDTTRKKGEFEKIYEDFKLGKADILVGTQMVSKGLDFPNVTLVGVVSADISLNIPDFKSHENTFQLLTQVSGRAGRGEKHGKVIIQTYQVNDFAIEKVIDGDMIGFYRNEIENRRMLSYPPFSKLFLIGMTSEDKDKLVEFADKISNEIKLMIIGNDTIKILGPTQSLVGRINRKWRWQIILKGTISTELMMKIKIRVYELTKEVYNIIKVSLDVNPNNMI